MKTIAVVQESLDYHEAVYIDGKLHCDKETIFACELAQLADGKPFKLEFYHCGDMEYWPKLLEDLKLEQP